MNYTAIIIINHIIGCDLNDDKNKNQEKNVKTKPKNINSWFENLMRYLCSAISRNAKFFSHTLLLQNSRNNPKYSRRITIKKTKIIMNLYHEYGYLAIESSSFK